MEVFFSALNQMGVLATFVVVGYVLIKSGRVPAGSAAILSKLETYLFIPALVVGVFAEKITPENISASMFILGAGFILVCSTILPAIFFARLCGKGDRYIRKIYTYGLVFPNYSYMGNAVVSAVFPAIFMEYLFFTVPVGIAIYLWGMPALLMPDAGEKATLRERLKNLVNPTIFCMLIGMAIGYFSIPVPAFFMTAANALGSCMSPVAMLLTGMTIAMVDLRKVLRNVGTYQVSFLRLIVFPLIANAILSVLPVSKTAFICSVCYMAMPLGLNSIVIPGAYGQDTSVAAGMAVVSHLASCITIPLVFLLLMRLI